MKKISYFLAACLLLASAMLAGCSDNKSGSTNNGGATGTPTSYSTNNGSAGSYTNGNGANGYSNGSYTNSNGSAGNSVTNGLNASINNMRSNFSADM